MQGQDLPGVLASAVLRSGGGVADVLADLDAGALVRGYPMRGTVFLQSSADLLWTSQLCNAPALRAAERRRGQLGLDDAQVGTAREIALTALAAAPRGLPRTRLMALWDQAGIATAGGRGYHVLAHLIGCGEVCFGPWNGVDQNVVATSTWLPAGTSLEARFGGDRVAAVGEFLRRYLTTHGPATIRDFLWWTKLPVRETKAAWAQVVGDFETGPGEEPQAWRPGLREEVAAVGEAPARAFLLPGFDEFILGYQDRLFAMSPEEHALLVPGNNGVFGKSVVVDAHVRGIWKRGGRPGKRSPEVAWFAGAPATDVAALFAAFPFVGT